MSTPLPFPWQTDDLPHETIQELLAVYDEAKKRAQEANQAGQWGVSSAWDRYAMEIAGKIVEYARELLK